MKFPFLADGYFTSVCEITGAYLKAHGRSGVLVDLDNTLGEYEQPDPNLEVIRWVNQMQQEGIQVLVFSNNHEPRVSRFARGLGCAWLSEAGKPNPKAYIHGAELLNLSLSQVAVIGDQIFTDTYGARRAGVSTILVQPLRLYGWYALRYVAEWPFVQMTRYRMKRKKAWE